MFKTPLTVLPRDAAPGDVSEALTWLSGAQALPFHGWDRTYSARIQNLAGWLHCVAMWRGHDLTEAPDIPEGGGQVVIHALINAHVAMLARHEAELAPYKGADGTLLGKGHDEHDEVADRHIGEVVEMLGLVMAVLVGEFGRAAGTP